MGFTKQKFGLFFSLPLDAQDWTHLQASGVKLVMLPLEFADALTLQRMKGMGVGVILRVNENAIYDDLAPPRIRNSVFTATQHCTVVMAIVGNESENAQDFSYTANTFGQQFAYVHRQRFDAVRLALQSIGVKVCSPAFTCRMLTESDKPQPGETSWREIVTLPQQANGGPPSFGYSDADYNGFHCYSHNWLGPVDELRVLFMLQRAQTVWHKELLIDELGINSGTPIERMRAYIDIAEMLLDPRLPYGARVAGLIPFLANGDPGNPPAWSPGYLIRDPKAYELLGAWIRG